MSNDLTRQDVPAVRSELVARSWRTEPLGVHDLEVEIWYNNNWVPAFLSDVKAGDFFNYIKHPNQPMKCYLAKSDVRWSQYRGRWGVQDGEYTFVVGALEIVQAPSITEQLKDVPAIEADAPKLLK